MNILELSEIGKLHNYIFLRLHIHHLMSEMCKCYIKPFIGKTWLYKKRYGHYEVLMQQAYLYINNLALVIWLRKKP